MNKILFKMFSLLVAAIFAISGVRTAFAGGGYAFCTDTAGVIIGVEQKVSKLVPIVSEGNVCGDGSYGLGELWNDANGAAFTGVKWFANLKDALAVAQPFISTHGGGRLFYNKDATLAGKWTTDSSGTTLVTEGGNEVQIPLQPTIVSNPKSTMLPDPKWCDKLADGQGHEIGTFEPGDSVSNVAPCNGAYYVIDGTGLKFQGNMSSVYPVKDGGFSNAFHDGTGMFQADTGADHAVANQGFTLWVANNIAALKTKASAAPDLNANAPWEYHSLSQWADVCKNFDGTVVEISGWADHKFNTDTRLVGTCTGIANQVSKRGWINGSAKFLEGVQFVPTTPGTDYDLFFDTDPGYLKWLSMSDTGTQNAPDTGVPTVTVPGDNNLPKTGMMPDDDKPMTHSEFNQAFQILMDKVDFGLQLICTQAMKVDPTACSGKP